MTAGLEIKDEKGNVVLTSLDTFLTYPTTTPTNIVVNTNVNYSNTYIRNPKDKTLLTQNVCTGKVTVPEGKICLMQPSDGMTLSYIPDDLTYNVSSFQSNNGKVVGRYLTMEVTPKSANFLSGYLDCMDEAGNLTWSVASIANSIQLAQVTYSEVQHGMLIDNIPPFTFTAPDGYSPDDFYFLPVVYFNAQRTNSMPDTQNVYMWTEMLMQRSGNTYYAYPVSRVSSVYGNSSSLQHLNNAIKVNGTTYEFWQFSYYMFVFWKPPT